MRKDHQPWHGDDAGSALVEYLGCQHQGLWQHAGNRGRHDLDDALDQRDRRNLDDLGDVGLDIRQASTQTIAHGLGQTPSALLLWTSGSTAAGFNNSDWSALGMTDGTTSYSTARTAANAFAGSNTSRRAAAKAITIVDGGQVLLAEADLSVVGRNQLHAQLDDQQQRRRLHDSFPRASAASRRRCSSGRQPRAPATRR